MMREDIKMPDGLAVGEYNVEGYDRTLTFATWRVAILNYADRFDNIAYLERHLMTDEVFVLLNGTAELLIGETGTKVQLGPCRLYNVKAGTWHNIRVSRDAKVLVIENSDTGKENTEYMEYK